jgi:hypothetical protein
MRSTLEAKTLMQGNPEAFRRAYGDYFIAGGLAPLRFPAIYACQSSSAESMTQWKSEADRGSSLGVERRRLCRLQAGCFQVQ